jgi:hypothetical protein
MRKLLIILFLFTTSVVYSATYIVAPTGGNDNNPGTIGSPWATVNKALRTPEAGDTVYFRGGTWKPTDWIIYNPSSNQGHNGTRGNEIVFINYPGEVPIIDFSEQPFTTSKSAVDIRNVTFAKFIGLQFCNNFQIVTDQWVSCLQIATCGNIWVENCKIHHNGGYGVLTLGFDTLYLTNVDSYCNFDSLDTDPGNTADGFAINNGGFDLDTFKIFYMTGCRAWGNSDDGFELDYCHQMQVSNCWSFGNGIEHGAGSGIKTRVSAIDLPSKRRISNTLTAWNKGVGYPIGNISIDDVHGPIAEYLNNTSYKNSMGMDSSPSGNPGTYNCNTGNANVVYRNNLVYASRFSAYYDQAYMAVCMYQTPSWPHYVHMSHNTFYIKTTSPYWQYNDTISWAYTGKDAQFTSLPDSANTRSLLSAPRKANGDLPDITAFRLAEGSVLIGAGVNVGMSATPDIGIDWAYYDAQQTPVVTRKFMPSKNGTWTKSIRGVPLITQ